EKLQPCALEMEGAFGSVSKYWIQEILPAIACPGDTIIIKGAGLGGNSAKVSFGGVLADPEPGATDTELTVVVPAGAKVPLSLVLPAQEYLVCGRLVESISSGRVDSPFQIGVAEIEAFFDSHPTMNAIVCVTPGQRIALNWRVRGARTVVVEVRDENNHIVVHSDPAPSLGYFGSLFASKTNRSISWTGFIRAEGYCGDVAVKQLEIRITQDPGLLVSGIEITQAIQYFQSGRHLTDPNDVKPTNSMRLIAGKAAFIRVYPTSTRDPAFDSGRTLDVTCTLLVEREKPAGGWEAVPVTQFGAVGATVVDANDSYDKLRSNLNRTFNFLLVAAEMRGTLRITATL